MTKGCAVNAGRFVGRVGALAVLLGAGAATSLGHGVASADDSPRTGPAAHSSRSVHGPSAPKSRARAAVQTGEKVSSRTAGLIPSLPRRPAAPALSDSLALVVSERQRSRGNRRPSVAVTVSGQGPDGTISGSFNAVDAESDPIEYVVTDDPGKGAVFVDVNGSFMYTPGPQILATGGSDAFKVAVFDPGHHGLRGPLSANFVKVTVNVKSQSTDSPRATVAAEVTLPGFPQGAPALMTSDGTRALLITAVTKRSRTTNTLAVADATTGGQIGSQIKLKGHVESALLSDDGRRAVITTADGSGTRVTVLDMTTGLQAGATIALGDASAASPVLSADGGRALIVTRRYDPKGATPTRLTVIDTASGALLRTVEVPGLSSNPLLNADGTRAVVTLGPPSYDPTATSIQVAVINTVTGATLGTSTVPCGPSVVPEMISDDERVLIVTESTDKSSHLAIVDTRTGSQIGATLAFDGHVMQVRVDGPKVLVVTDAFDEVTRTDTTRVVLADSTTGTHSGSTVVLPGAVFPDSLVLTSDGSRAVVTTHVYDNATGAASTSVAVVDAIQGGQIGPPLVVDGFLSAGNPVLSADGHRALVVASDAVGGMPSRVLVVDMQTGAQVGNTLPFNGKASAPVVSSNGDRAVITSASGQDGAQVAVIDLITGTQVGTALALPGADVQPVLSSDGTRAVVATVADYNGYAGTATSGVVVIDTATGAQVGNAVTLPGLLGGQPLLSADGNHALATATQYDSVTDTTTLEVAVIDLAAGVTTVSVITLPGVGSSPIVSTDGTRALFITGRSEYLGTGTRTTELAVINTSTGAVIGSPITLAGGVIGYPMISADRTHALVTTYGSAGASYNTRLAMLEIS